MITPDDFARILDSLFVAGYAQDDINWSETCAPPIDADAFAGEVIFVICNSGMKNTIARRIFGKVMDALENGRFVHAVFGHKGKVEAICHVWEHRETLFADLIRTIAAGGDMIEWCVALPFIGNITKYHLAKNFGAQVAKPDVHLQRLADRESCTPQQLCERLSEASGLRIATVDVLLWRACAIGVIDSKTGTISEQLRTSTPFIEDVT